MGGPLLVRPHRTRANVRVLPHRHGSMRRAPPYISTRRLKCSGWACIPCATRQRRLPPARSSRIAPLLSVGAAPTYCEGWRPSALRDTEAPGPGLTLKAGQGPITPWVIPSSLVRGEVAHAWRCATCRQRVARVGEPMQGGIPRTCESIVGRGGSSWGAGRQKAPENICIVCLRF